MDYTKKQHEFYERINEMFGGDIKKAFTNASIYFGTNITAGFNECVIQCRDFTYCITEMFAQADEINMPYTYLMEVWNTKWFINKNDIPSFSESVQDTELKLENFERLAYDIKCYQLAFDITDFINDVDYDEYQIDSLKKFEDTVARNYFNILCKPEVILKLLRSYLEREGYFSENTAMECDILIGRLTKTLYKEAERLADELLRYMEDKDWYTFYDITALDNDEVVIEKNFIFKCLISGDVKNIIETLSNFDDENTAKDLMLRVKKFSK